MPSSDIDKHRCVVRRARAVSTSRIRLGQHHFPFQSTSETVLGGARPVSSGKDDHSPEPREDGQDSAGICCTSDHSATSANGRVVWRAAESCHGFLLNTTQTHAQLPVRRCQSSQRKSHRFWYRDVAYRLQRLRTWNALAYGEPWGVGRIENPGLLAGYGFASTKNAPGLPDSRSSRRKLKQRQSMKLSRTFVSVRSDLTSTPRIYNKAICMIFEHL